MVSAEAKTEHTSATWSRCMWNPGDEDRNARPCIIQAEFTRGKRPVAQFFALFAAAVDHCCLYAPRVPIAVSVRPSLPLGCPSTAAPSAPLQWTHRTVLQCGTVVGVGRLRTSRTNDSFKHQVNSRPRRCVVRARQVQHCCRLYRIAAYGAGRRMAQRQWVHDVACTSATTSTTATTTTTIICILSLKRARVAVNLICLTYIIIAITQCIR